MKTNQSIKRGGFGLAVLALSSTLTAGITALGAERIEGFRDTPVIPGTKWH
jgi:hypothetical protein